MSKLMETLRIVKKVDRARRQVSTSQMRSSWMTPQELNEERELAQRERTLVDMGFPKLQPK